MWTKIKQKFENYPAQIKVMEKMIELGLKIGEDNSIYCSNLKISDQSLAKSIDVDRRTIKRTINSINQDKELKTIFTNITPAGTLLKNIAKHIELSAIEIETTTENEGVLSKTAEIFSKNKINIRQAYAEDTAITDNPKLTIITEKKISPEVIDEIMKIKGIEKISFY